MDLLSVAVTAWDACGAALRGAAVFADEAFAAVAACPAEPDAVVLLVSAHLSRSADHIRAVLLSHPYTSCCIVTPIAEALHTIEVAADPSLVGVWSNAAADSSPSGQHPQSQPQGYYATVETKLVEWMAESALAHGRSLDRAPVASIMHQPLCYSIVTNGLFLLPQSASFFPPLASQSGGSPAARAASPVSGSNISIDSSPPISGRTSRTGSYDDVRGAEEIFAIGSASRQIARAIISQSVSSRRRTAERSAALILVDRTHDLAAPTMHSDCLLDQIWSVLPRQTPKSIQVVASPQFMVSDNDPGSVPHGPRLSLAHGMDSDAMDFISVLLQLGQKEGLVATRRRLLDVLARELPDSPRPKALGRVTTEQLESLACNLRGQHALWFRREGMLKYLTAAVESSIEAPKFKWDELSSIERVLIQSFTETYDSSSMAQQLRDLLVQFVHAKQQHQQTAGIVTAKEVLMLMLYCYSLLGDTASISARDEATLQEALFKAMMASSNSANARAIQGWVARAFSQLRLVSQARAGQTRFRDVLAPHQQPPYDPLLVQIGRAAVQPPEAQLAHGAQHDPQGQSSADGWTHVPYGGTLGSVMSGFSRLLGGAPQKPHPSHHPTVILVVLGGITFQEAGRVRDELAARGHTAIVGSTNIATTDTIMAQLFKAR
ncbi:Sec1 domain-containing protein 2 [Polyrhizophydium stewartii]|uniref:Sec1 domain-containing protein 2 n=1 Tax=Polyrhizophydium stewartii TaxID=2732419 RepID=A0ABR4N872_9FUNG